MFTRNQYLNKECTHRQYYAQFINEAVKALVPFSENEIRESYNSLENLNTLPLHKLYTTKVYTDTWDYAAKQLESTVKKVSFKEVGDSPTLSGNVCILKEAALQIIGK